MGRNGQHRYNNQDHSMLTAIYAAKNIRGELDAAGRPHDIWAVNTEQEYHEQGDGDTEEVQTSAGPSRFPGMDPNDPRVIAIEQTLYRFDTVALGLACGVALGLSLFLATAILLLRGGQDVGVNLALLGNYFVGYKVSWPGAFIGLIEGSIGGYLVGWMIAVLCNISVGVHERNLMKMSEFDGAAVNTEGR
jgi:hypothetical protein